MKYIISGRKIEVTDEIREKINKKFGRLEKFFGADAEAHITLDERKDVKIIEATIYFGHMMLRAEEEKYDLFAALDRIIDVLERQIRKNKTRIERKLKEGIVKEHFPEILENEEEEGEFKIVRRKKFSVKPMLVEEAILQMNLLGHSFFVFVDPETNGTSIVYKRKEKGTYGLIEV